MIEKIRDEWDDFRYEHDPIVDEVWDQRRWVTVHRAVYEVEGRFYEVIYESPSTEMQEGSESDEVLVYEVEPIEVTVTKYKRL